MKTVRILSVDGGGIRGLMPAILLSSLERISGRCIHEMFDFVTGTSTGAILAGALFKRSPLPAEQIVDHYIRNGKRIFPPDTLRHLTSAVAGPKYPEKPLEDVLLAVFGDAWLSECIKPLMIPSYELTSRQAWFFKSWKAAGQDISPSDYPGLFDYRLGDVVRASSAAPTYFRPARIRSRAGVLGAFIDGAVVANNPALSIIASARKLNPDVSRIVLLSLGTGQQVSPIAYTESSTWGLLNWARPMFDCMMDAQSDIVTYQVAEAFGSEVQQIRFDFLQNGSPLTSAIDDASDSNIRRMIVEADNEVRRNSSEIGRILDLLAPRKTPIA